MRISDWSSDVCSSDLDELNTGASNDIQQATDMARSMVMEYGMSEKLGWLRDRDNQDEVFLGHSVSRAQNMSEETAKLIDSEVRRLVEAGDVTARKVLKLGRAAWRERGWREGGIAG